MVLAQGHSAPCAHCIQGDRGLVDGAFPRCGQERRTLLAFHTQAVGELYGEMARGSAYTGLDLLDAIRRATRLRGQRHLCQIMRLARCAATARRLPPLQCCA